MRTACLLILHLLVGLMAEVVVDPPDRRPNLHPFELEPGAPPPAAPARWTVDPQGIVRVEPVAYDGPMRNPMRGLYGREYWFTNGIERPGGRRWTTTYRGLIAWNWLERTAADGPERIAQQTERLWTGFTEAECFVIPRLYLDWPGPTRFDQLEFAFGNRHWPSDLTEGDYSSPQFRERLKRLAARLAQAWDADARVAFIQTGTYGRWGEQHSPEPDQQAIRESFGVAFKNKKLLVRYPQNWTDPGFTPGGYHDSFASTVETQVLAEFLERTGRWRDQPFMGEVAFDYGDKQFIGRNPDEGVRGERAFYIANAARWCHISGLCWVGDYGANNWGLGKDGAWRSTWPWHARQKPEIIREAVAGAALLQRHLGYQYTLLAASYPARIDPGRRFEVAFTVRNDGSAPFYYAWPVVVSLHRADGVVVWSADVAGADVRTWLPGHGIAGATYPFPESWGREIQPWVDPPREHRVVGSFVLPPAVPGGDHELRLAVVEPTGRAATLRLATWLVREDGRHPLGMIGVGAPAGRVELSDAMSGPSGSPRR